MSVITGLKRQNFNVTPEQEAELLSLQTELAAPSVKDAILRATRLVLTLTREVRDGKRISLKDRNGTVTEVTLPDLESVAPQTWTYLVERPGSWKRQLFVKGRRLAAAQVRLDMKANGMTEAQAAENWDLPAEAVAKIVSDCQDSAGLLRMEADEERLFLSAHGVRLSA